MTSMETSPRAITSITKPCQSNNNTDASSQNNDVTLPTTSTTLTTATDTSTTNSSCSETIERSTTMGPNHQNARENTKVTEIIIPTVEELMTEACNVTCPEGGCGKVLRCSSALRFHLNKTHGIYQSPEEKDLFSQKHASVSKPSTPVQKQYCCPVDKCQRSKASNKPFQRMSELKQHYIGVHAEKIHQCSKCPAKFGMVKLLTKHEGTCGVTYKCTCAAEYTNKKALLSHAKYRKHQLPPDFLLRPQKQRQKELQKQQAYLQKLQHQEQRKRQHQIAKQLAKEIEKKHSKELRTGPLPILPKMIPLIPNMMYAVPVAPQQVLQTMPIMKSTATQTLRGSRGPAKKSKKAVSKGIQSGEDQLQQSLIQEQAPVSPSQCASSMCNIVPSTPNYPQNFQDSGVNTSLVSATHIETQTLGSGFQSSHTCTQTHGDVIVRNALLSANIETQTSVSNTHVQLVQSSTQYSNMYVASTAETQTTHPSLSLQHNSMFDLDAMSVNNSQSAGQVVCHPAVQTQTSATSTAVSCSDAQTDNWLVSQVASHPAVHTQTSATSTLVSSSDAQTDNWLSALYDSPPSNNSPALDSPASDLTQPANVPTQTDLSFLDMLNFCHSETQTMNSLDSFVTESSSTQTHQMAQNTSSSSAHLQSTEVQTQAGLAKSLPLNTSQTQTSLGPLSLNTSQTQTSLGSLPLNTSQTQTSLGSLPLNTSQTQTSFADFCLGDMFFSESESQTNPRVPFGLEDSLSSSHQQTQTGTLAPTGHQGTQTAAEKELDAALSMLNTYTQTNQTESRNDSPRPDSLSELEFTSMHTQTMEDVLAVLDNDNQSTSVQTDFAMFAIASDHRSFGVSTEDLTPPSMSNNAGVGVQTDTLDLSSFQNFDFYSNSSSSSQT